jgi:hypothetical protein
MVNGTGIEAGAATGVVTNKGRPVLEPSGGAGNRRTEVPGVVPVNMMVKEEIVGSSSGVEECFHFVGCELL